MSRANRLLSIALLLCFLSLSSAGCYDQRPIDTLGLIIGIGIDENQNNPQLTDFTFGHPLFEERRRAAARISTVTAASFGQAEELWQLQHDLLFSPGKVRLAVISQDKAERGIFGALEYVNLPKTDDRMWVAVSRSRAEELLRAKPLENERIATHTAEVIERATRAGATFSTNVAKLITLYAAEGIDPVLPLLDVSSGKDVVAIVGTALLNDLTMVGELDRDETKLLLALKGESRNINFSPALGVTGESYSTYPQIRLVAPSARITPKLQDGELTVTVDFKASYVLRVKSVIANVSEAGPAEQITKDLESNLTIALQEMLQKLQSVRTDPLGVGKKLRVRSHRDYDDNKARELWSAAKLDIRVDLTFVRDGTLIKTVFDRR